MKRVSIVSHKQPWSDVDTNFQNLSAIGKGAIGCVLNPFLEKGEQKVSGNDTFLSTVKSTALGGIHHSSLSDLNDDCKGLNGKTSWTWFRSGV